MKHVTVSFILSLSVLAFAVAATSNFACGQEYNKGFHRAGPFFNVTAYGASGDKRADDTGSLQAALNACGAAGGGIVVIPGGVYLTTYPLTVPDHCAVIGAGMGSTVLRPQSTFRSIAIKGVTATYIIGGVASSDVDITDLTVDLHTNNVTMDGIAFQLDHANNRSSNVLIQRDEVLGIDAWEYLVWLRGVTHGKVLDCRINGYVPSGNTSLEEGIETSGATDIIISRNTISNIGNSGVYVYTGAAPADTSDILIDKNYINNANVAILIHIAAAVSRVHVTNNFIILPRSTGIVGEQASGVAALDLQFDGNSIESPPIGIELIGQSLDWEAVSVRNNTIRNASSPGQAALVISKVNNADMSNNQIVNSEANGIDVVLSSDVSVQANRIEGGVGSIRLSSTTRVYVANNQLTNWDIANGSAAAIAGTGNSQAVVLDNVFYRSSGDPIVINITGNANQIAGNRVTYDASGQGDMWYNPGTNPNVGTVTFVVGATSATVNNTLVTGTSRIVLIQEAGTPQPFKVTQVGKVSFTVTLPAAAYGTERFRYEIYP